MKALIYTDKNDRLKKVVLASEAEFYAKYARVMKAGGCIQWEGAAADLDTQWNRLKQICGG